MKTNIIYCGDCLQVLKTFPDNSIDSIITDPPYGLEFMGKDWDKFKQEKNDYYNFTFKWARECWRILKPGGFILSFGGARTYHRLACAIEDAGFEIKDMIEWIYGSGMPKSTNLKPAHEPICLARKPISEKNLMNNVQKWGTGRLNIDVCRIMTGEKIEVGRSGRKHKSLFQSSNVNSEQRVFQNKGRFPANLIHDGSQEVLNLFPETNSPGKYHSGSIRKTLKKDNLYNLSFLKGENKQEAPDNYGDKGSAARFFYCAKASKNERNEGLDNKKNIHPTVKPIALIRYLIRLITPKGGLVLDPFIGSGTTGIAALLEGMLYIGVEKEPEYTKIAEKRIQYFKNDMIKEKK